MEWIKNRWVITVLICILVITAAILIVLLVCQPREGTYTNAWYVKCDNDFIDAGGEKTCLLPTAPFLLSFSFGRSGYVYGA